MSDGYTFINRDTSLSVKTVDSQQTMTLDCLIDDYYRVPSIRVGQDIFNCIHLFRIEGYHTLRLIDANSTFSSHEVYIQVYGDIIIDKVSPSTVINNDQDIVITLHARNNLPVELISYCKYSNTVVKAQHAGSRTLKCTANFKNVTSNTIEFGLLSQDVTFSTLPIQVVSHHLLIESISPLKVPLIGKHEFKFRLTDKTGLGLNQPS